MELDKNKVWLLIGIGIFIVFIGFLVWSSVGGKEAVAGKAHGTNVELNCHDNIDNDGDGKVDCADSNCNMQQGGASANIKCEYGTELSCYDGFDNDRDGIVAHTTLGEVVIAGKTIPAAKIDAVVFANLGGKGILVNKLNIDTIGLTTGRGNIPELDPCVFNGCNMIYVKDNLALITTSNGMQVVDTSNWANFPTNEGAKTGSHIQTQVAKVVPVEVDTHTTVTLDQVAANVNIGKQNFGSGGASTGMLVASSSGTDCEDSDCDGKLGPDGVNCGEAVCIPKSATCAATGITCPGNTVIAQITCPSGQTCNAQGVCEALSPECTQPQNWNQSGCHNQPCNSSNSSKSVIWSYDLSSTSDNSKKLTGTPPLMGYIECCGSNSCVYTTTAGTKTCTNPGELMPSSSGGVQALFLCGGGNDWVKCYSATKGTTQLAGSKT
ncbi:hypothetical protein HZC30_02710 [Candidatus Woesearchaeota archaeon]|nr:hypothetical protein [Candidatus Woesearchaeota archaeon]